MILKKELRTIKKKGLEKIQPDTQKAYQVKCVLFEYSTSREERKEEKAMLKILKEVQEPTSYDEDGEPDQWQLVGFEIE